MRRVCGCGCIHRWAPWVCCCPSRWRRLHRKLCVVDGHLLFCGGINVLDDFHDPNHGVLDRAAA
jgi:phosphatidylserine/phosphatidylglycerophosphate/cardiolipin synthase-like enzyme